MEFPKKKYMAILADPPWIYTLPHTRKTPQNDYTTLKTNDICNISVHKIADSDCVLFLWTNFNKLPDALEVINAWGFKYKTCAFVWVKRNKNANSLFFGMGNWTRQNVELCILGTKGKPKRIHKDIHSVVVSPVKKHSSKPKEVYQRIEDLLGHIPKIELFARDHREGWDVWGNEIPNTLQTRFCETKTHDYM